jgi:hypothetical protein
LRRRLSVVVYALLALLALLDLLALLALTAACAHGAAEPDERTVREFRQRVLAVLATEFPDRKFVAAANDPHIIEMGKARFGLDNLYKKFQRTDGGAAALRDVVREHFQTTVASADAAAAAANMDWPAARTRVRPQLFPIEWIDRLSLVHRPFASGAALGFVLDFAKSTQYVRVDDMARWHVTLDELSASAFANLELASKGIRPVSGGHEGDRFLVLETGDSYDAVRLFLPSVRESAAKTLGTPFLAAVPSRGRLFLWPTGSSAQFQEHTRNVVRQDFTADPYPLSASTFSVTGSTMTEITP